MLVNKIIVNNKVILIKLYTLFTSYHSLTRNLLPTFSDYHNSTKKKELKIFTSK